MFYTKYQRLCKLELCASWAVSAKGNKTSTTELNIFLSTYPITWETSCTSYLSQKIIPISSLGCKTGMFIRKVLWNFVEAPLAFRFKFGVVSKNTIPERSVHLYNQDGRFSEPTDFEILLTERTGQSQMYLASTVVSCMLMTSSTEKQNPTETNNFMVQESSGKFLWSLKTWAVFYIILIHIFRCISACGWEEALGQRNCSKCFGVTIKKQVEENTFSWGVIAGTGSDRDHKLWSWHDFHRRGSWNWENTRSLGRTFQIHWQTRQWEEITPSCFLHTKE